MLENKKIMVPYIGEEVHISRLIASWLKAGGNMYEDTLDEDGVPEYAFLVWLQELGVSERDIYHIWAIAGMGKLELEYSVRKFRETHEVLDE